MTDRLDEKVVEDSDVAFCLLTANGLQVDWTIIVYAGNDEKSSGNGSMRRKLSRSLGNEDSLDGSRWSEEHRWIALIQEFTKMAV